MANNILTSLPGFSIIRSALSFVRWRVVAVRYLGYFLRTGRLKRGTNAVPKSREGQLLEKQGHLDTWQVTGKIAEELFASFGSRNPEQKNTKQRHSFVNLLKEEDITENSAILKLLYSDKVFDVALDYFDGNFSLYNIQVLYSYPETGELKESQLWHKDYGDSRTLHFIVYLTDVTEDGDGPFVFADRKDSKKIRNLKIVRRIPDAKFAIELGDGKIRKVLGKKGTAFAVDPSACYHCGSRCTSPRLAIFISFNTATPFIKSAPFVVNNQAALKIVGKSLRPDIPPEVFDCMFV